MTLLRDAPFDDSWQVPAVTEQLQYELWRDFIELEGFSTDGINSYLGLPWATYIDRGSVPDFVRVAFQHNWLRLPEAAGSRKAIPRLHTVCQHIYWQRLLPFWREVGITDLHLSHLEPDVYLEDICVHSWHLAAANVVNEDRREGLVFGKDPSTKRWLASFIGAHMPHYRSNVRLQLREEAVRDGFHDILYELKEDWHFNPVVYQEQVQGRPLDVAQRVTEHRATVHYNKVLSDSVFALCPEGAGPNTIRLWEALAVGSVPVVIVEDWVWPTIPGDDIAWSDAVVHVGRNEIAGLFDRLRWMRRFEPRWVVSMQQAAMEIYRRFEAKRCF